MKQSWGMIWNETEKYDSDDATTLKVICVYVL